MAKSRQVTEQDIESLPDLPTPKFHLSFRNTEKNVAVDERSAIFEAALIARGVDWNHFQLDQVQILFNTCRLPERITVNGVAKTEKDAWFYLTEPFTIESDDPVIRKVEIRTGFFAAIQLAEARTSGKGYIEACTQTLLEHPAAEPAETISLHAHVQCIVRRKHGEKPVTYGTSGGLTFSVDVD